MPLLLCVTAGDRVLASRWSIVGTFIVTGIICKVTSKVKGRGPSEKGKQAVVVHPSTGWALGV